MTASSQISELLDNAEAVRHSHQLRSGFQNESRQHLWWTFLFSMSTPGTVWLAARHNRMDYIYARILTALPFVFCVFLAGQGKITWTQANYAKTLGAVASVAYVLPKAAHRRNCAKHVDKFLRDLDEAERA